MRSSRSGGNMSSSSANPNKNYNDKELKERIHDSSVKFSFEFGLRPLFMKYDTICH